MKASSPPRPLMYHVGQATVRKGVPAEVTHEHPPPPQNEKNSLRSTLTDLALSQWRCCSRSVCQAYDSLLHNARGNQ
jgi:hypothetical protein